MLNFFDFPIFFQSKETDFSTIAPNYKQNKNDSNLVNSIYWNLKNSNQKRGQKLGWLITLYKIIHFWNVQNKDHERIWIICTLNNNNNTGPQNNDPLVAITTYYNQIFVSKISLFVKGNRMPWRNGSVHGCSSVRWARSILLRPQCA